MWSDTESSEDYLNFGEIADIAVDIVSSPTMLPVSIGIFGTWGSGKSSILKLIENELDTNKEKYLKINFDAWLYQGYDDARLSLMETIVTELRKVVKDNEKLAKRIYNLFSRIDFLRLAGIVGESVALAHGIPTGGLIAKGVSVIENLKDGIQTAEEYQDIGNTIDTVKEKNSGLIKPLPEKTPPQHIDAFRKEYSEIIKEVNKTLVIIIDNLDRCNPVNAIQTLEAIRLFLFLENTAFILAVDEDMIRASVKECFKGSDEKHQIDYLDKLIQVPIRVPKIGVREIRAYLFMLYALDKNIPQDKINRLRDMLENNLRSSWKDEPINHDALLAVFDQNDKERLSQDYELADRIAPLLASSPFIEGNPRIIKRLLNVVKMRSQTAKRRNIPLDEALITKLVIFERCVGQELTSDFYRLVDSENGKPEFLQTDKKGEFKKSSPESWKKDAVCFFIPEWLKLEPSLNNVDLRPAIYLSRETRSLGINSKELSKEAQELLGALLKVKNQSSPSIVPRLSTLLIDEELIIMKNIIKQLRSITDWTKRPDGFAGACILADNSPNAAKLLTAFIKEIVSQNIPWLNAMVKDKEWYNTRK